MLVTRFCTPAIPLSTLTGAAAGTGPAPRCVYWLGRVQEAQPEQVEVGRVEPLIQDLRDEVDLVASKMAEALGKLGDRRAVEPLEAALAPAESLASLAAETALSCRHEQIRPQHLGQGLEGDRQARDDDHHGAGDWQEPRGKARAEVWSLEEPCRVDQQ